MSTITYYTRTVPNTGSATPSATGIWDQTVLKSNTLLPFPTDQQTADDIQSKVLSAIWVSSKGRSRIQNRVCVDAYPDETVSKGELSIEKDVTTQTVKSLMDSGPLWVAAEGRMITNEVESLHEVNRVVLSQVKPAKLSVGFQSMSQKDMEKLTGIVFTTDLHQKSVGEAVAPHVTKSNSRW
uniref:Uncharacterized protein n=1 Tax=Kwoniella bestiolae CBS 10118 TaxID=1296100 RepID=A0A1B9G367_9TREE|nr:hypothetical protein I302_05299 [Kwoniella bestiolae CBS 10118]OCF25479.1 hypothetical protein I302_05299 [Kwoniella bestiolae CBS 10118]